jgi:hypothetical protein
MSPWLEKPRRRPNSSHRASGRTTVRSSFQKFCWNSFLIWAASEWLIWCTQFPYLMLTHQDHEDWLPDVYILNVILALWMGVPGRESTSSGRLQRSSHIYVLERIPIAGRTLSVVRTSCWNVRTDASWSSSKLLDTKEGPDGKFSSSGRMMLWTNGHPDGISCRSNGCKGSDFSDL